MKTKPPKKMSIEESDAQYALSSAVVRGSSQEVLEDLRLKLALIRKKQMKPIKYLTDK